ncbi:peptidase family C50-domain-containing protein [Chiua virens]|nr:peptidase family C50-domain-containing protein [Chiua virens]
MPPTKTANSAWRTTRVKVTTTTDDLRTKFATKLTLHDRNPSQKQLSRVEPTEDERTTCMRAVNLSLQTLSEATQSGWKFTPEGTKNARNANTTARKVDDATKTAKKALQGLREISPDDLDVERAACGITGKLITLEMYEEAVQFLKDMHPRLLRIAATDQSGAEHSSPLHLLVLPRPTSCDPTILTLLITSVTHALNALLSLLLRPSLPFSARALVSTLQHSHSLLAWAPSMKRDNIPEKTRDALLTKAYTFINKACTALSSGDRSNADPKSIFHLRIYALSCLLHTTSGTIKSSTFWDHVHKACLFYARTEPTKQDGELDRAARVSCSLTEVVKLAQSLHESTFSDGRSFVQMCETWMNFAQKVISTRFTSCVILFKLAECDYGAQGDISSLDYISELMGIPRSYSASTQNFDGGALASKSGPLPSFYSVDSLVARVEGLKLSENEGTNGVKVASHHVTKDSTLVECAQCCGAFVKATAGLDTECRPVPICSVHVLTTSQGPEVTRHVKEAVEAVRRYSKVMSNLDSLIFLDSQQQSIASSLSDSTSHSSAKDAEVLRARGKLERALERLRRAGIRVLDAPQMQNKDLGHAATSLLEVIATALETCSRRRTEMKDTLTSLVDVFFVLGRSRLNPNDVESYTPALNYLKRAIAAINSCSIPITTEDVATLLRCVSGTLHNLGGTLYAAGRLGAAVRFLEEGCILGKRVLGMYGNMCNNVPAGASDREKEGRQQLEEQLFRRYELLGVCHSKIGDRKLAYDCFIDSVRTFPYTHYPANFFSVNPFASNAPPPLTQLSAILDRLTYTATCELFLPPGQISLRHLSNSPFASDRSSTPDAFPSDGLSKAEVAGAILTRQLATLEGIGHKDGASEAIAQIMEDLLSVYDAREAPIQRARVLVTAFSVSWRDRRSDGSDASTQFNVDHVSREALDLLSHKTPESDDLATLVPQLKLGTHMWLALHGYRRSPPGAEIMNTVGMHVEAAYNVLSGLLPGSEKTTALEASPKGKQSTTGVGVRALAKAPKSNTTGSKRGRSAADGVGKSSKKATTGTAKSQPRKAIKMVLKTGDPTPCNSPITKRSATAIDLQPVLGLIQMNVHLLGLLGLIVLKVKLLEILKRVCEHQAPVPAEAYSMICVDLAHEYIKLGKFKRANALFNKCANLLKAGEVPDEVRLQYFLGHAEVLALGDNIPASLSYYHDAQGLEAVVSVEDKTMPTAKRIRARVERLERAALACRVFAAVQYSKDNVIGALSAMLQSLRLWNRAIDALSRLAPPTSGGSKSVEDNSNPFEVSSNPNLNQNQPSSIAPLRWKPTPTDALSWRLLSHLMSTLFSLAHAYHVRGSSRETLYFVQQVLDLAESTRAPAVVARACVLRGEVLLGQGALKEGREAIDKAAGLLGGVLGLDAADAQRLKGDYGVLCEERTEREQGGGEQGAPTEHYERAWNILDELERRIVSFDGGRRKSSLEPLAMGGVVQGGQGMILPRLSSAILRRHIWLLRNNVDDAFKDLIERLMALPPSAEIKGEEHAIMGKLTLHSVYEQFHSDMFLSSLAESSALSSVRPSSYELMSRIAIALPMGMSGDNVSSPTPAVQDILNSLSDAEELFWADLALMWRRGAVSHVREATVSLAMIRALESSLGKTSADAPLLAARLLGKCAISFRCLTSSWCHVDASSAITLHREMLEAIPHKFANASGDDLQWPLMTDDGTSSGACNSPVDDDHDGVQRAYWSALEKKYTSLVLSPSSLVESAPKLPYNWTVIHITLTPDKSSMFISRLHSPSSQPLLFCVPLRGRRDAEEDDESRLLLEDALDELQEIVRLSDEGTRRAAHVRSDDLQARAGWWAERAALDKRLKALLENIEFCWLGAFKTILSPPSMLSSELIGDLRYTFGKAVQTQSSAARQEEEETSCRDEELEDLVYFILDLYQFHGVPIAISEVDMDQITVDLRTVLEEHMTARKKAKVMPVEDSHTFLVLDRNLQGIPWESLPVLRGQSVSRIPSLEFLLDRLCLGEMQRQRAGESGGALDRSGQDRGEVFLVAQGDAWGGVGRDRGSGLTAAFSYFGHGGGEQYCRSHKIRHLPRCAATMLWGCSSGALKEMGEFDRVGTPYNYMIAGCPTLVANLWDVTDRDIDKFTQGVFDELHLFPDSIGNGGASTSVVTAVARSRELCKLKYLTGAAPVVYGVPFYL